MRDGDLRQWKALVRQRADRERRELSVDVVDELACHLADLHATAVRNGASEAEARRRALDTLNAASFLELSKRLRARPGTRYLQDVGIAENRFQLLTMKDLVYAVRGLTRNPLFTAAAVLTLALGIGANSAIFTVVNAVLLRPLPYPAPDRLMMLWTYNPRQGYNKDVSAYPNFDDWRRQSASFDGMSAYFGASFTLTQAGDPAEIGGAIVTPGFFETLGVAPALGRTFGVHEGAAGGERVAILSHRLWQTRFGGNPAIVGRTVMLNSVSHEVLGVMPATFAHPERAAVWTPLAPSERLLPVMQSRTSYWLQVVGRLKPSIDRRTAQSEMDTIAQALERRYPDRNAGIGVRLVPMHEEIVGDVRQPLLILFGTAMLVLLIACANVANLLLARASSRQRELAIRTALGAGRRRLIAQLLTESLVLAALGGAAGLLLAAWGIQALPSLAPSNLPRLTGVHIDTSVILYTSLASLVTGLFFGAAPALQSATATAGEFLKERRAESQGARGRRLRAAFAIVEVALALVLVIAAGLLVRSFVAMNKVDLGFDPRGILALRVELPRARYSQDAQITAFFNDLTSRLRALPGVESIGLGSSIMRAQQSSTLLVQGRPGPDPNVPNLAVPYDSVTPEFFTTLRIPLRRGRLFTTADGPSTPRVVVVNESLVRRFFPDEDALGKRVTYDDPGNAQARWLTIVGIVGDTRRGGVDREPRAELYYPLAQVPERRMYALVRTSGDPLGLVRPAQAQVWAIDANQPTASVRSVEAILADAQANRRFTTLLLGLFSIVALALAAIGIYGVIAYSTAQRVQEIGIRMALGATRTNVLTSVLKEALMIGVAGLALGTAAALALTRFLSGLLFGVGARDPMTFVALPLGLLLVAVVAALIPAARAVRVSPLVALRGD
jgi:putative ABC transport system permease protein